MTIATAWGVTGSEQHRSYPCDDLVPAPAQRLFRGVDVAAPPDVVYRWLCQFRVAPYSYDWIDNAGRRSPRRPLPWTWDLEVGQTFSRIFTLVSFATDDHLTVRMNPAGARMFGDVAVTYAVLPSGRERSRLVAVLRSPQPTSRPGAVGAWLLAWGDLVMMRKQLLTFAHLAAAEHGAQSSV
ncbi:SRPBCC family protein [Cellulomonas humilata]|uniref:SRPBCC family protein n=1 Tax=Cellulomonas humilata TaxID=144055 RepID=UPI001B3565C1|nr:SRPBCC family protein [Cellulomonas humilata]